MEEKLLVLKIDELTNDVKKLTECLNNKPKNGLLKGILMSVVCLFLITIFWGGSAYNDIQMLKENTVPNNEWKDNEVKTTYLWNDHWGISNVGQTRGGTK